MNDETHLGFFDIPLLANIPNLVYLAPTCREEYFAMLGWAIRQTDHPVAVRVPDGGVVTSGATFETEYGALNRYLVTQRGSRVAILGLGNFYGLGEAAARRIEAATGIRPTLVNPRYITGVDEALLEPLRTDHEVVVTLEDGVLDGGFGEKIARWYGPTSMRVVCRGVRKEFADRYDARELLRANRLTEEQIAEDVMALLR